MRCSLPEILWAVLPAFSCLAQTSLEDFRITTDVDLVLLEISVKDLKGVHVSSLSKENFRVYDNGKPQAITQFSSNDIPVTVGLVVDKSGSMRPKYSEVTAAGMAFIHASNPLDEIFVINFNDHVKRGLPNHLLFSGDIQQLRAALMSGLPQGRTALYDAIAAALMHLEKGRFAMKNLLVISDGGDNVSVLDFKRIQRMVQESRATIYTIGLFDDDDPDRNPSVLRKLANISGGEAFLPKSLPEVTGICLKIAKDIRTRYTAGYVPVRHDRKNPVHKIKVAAWGPDNRKLVARTRTSYILPERGVSKN